MTNPTSNYGFVLPTATDLVTDLPADFEVALQGVDTRLKALQPGTTLGDLAYSSATANTNTRLAIGSTGNVLTVAGGVPSWAAPASSTPTFVGCVLTKSANQSVADNTNALVTFDVEDIDTDGFHSTSSNTERITIPSGKGGKYLITASLVWASNNSSYRNVFLFKNTTQISVAVQAGATFGNTTNVSFVVSATAGDYFLLKGYQNTGGAVDIQSNSWSTGGTYFTATLLGV